MTMVSAWTLDMSPLCFKHEMHNGAMSLQRYFQFLAFISY